MTRTSPLAATTAAVLLAMAGLTGCSSEAEAAGGESPIAIDEIAGSDVWRITLTESAAERLDIQTSKVETAADGLVVPSAAVIIDPDGIYWVYTNPEPLVYVRQEIRPVHEADLQAFFVEGPQAGESVVTIGVPELYGAEFGIGK